MNKWIDIYPNFAAFKLKMNAYKANLIEDTDSIFYVYLSAIFKIKPLLSSEESITTANTFKQFNQFKIVYIKILKEQEKGIIDLITTSSENLAKSSDEALTEADAKMFISSGGSNKIVPSVLNVIGGLVNLPNIYNELERQLLGLFAGVDSPQTGKPRFYQLGDEAQILDALGKGADNLIKNKLETFNWDAKIAPEILKIINADPTKYKGDKGDQGDQGDAGLDGTPADMKQVVSNTQEIGDVKVSLWNYDGSNLQTFLSSSLKRQNEAYFFQNKKDSNTTNLTLFRQDNKTKNEIYTYDPVNQSFNLVNLRANTIKKIDPNTKVLTNVLDENEVRALLGGAGSILTAQQRATLAKMKLNGFLITVDADISFIHDVMFQNNPYVSSQLTTKKTTGLVQKHQIDKMIVDDLSGSKLLMDSRDGAKWQVGDRLFANKDLNKVRFIHFNILLDKNDAWNTTRTISCFSITSSHNSIWKHSPAAYSLHPYKDYRLGVKLILTSNFTYNCEITANGKGENIKIVSVWGSK